LGTTRHSQAGIGKRVDHGGAYDNHPMGKPPRLSRL